MVCRAGTTTNFSMGDNASFLSGYCRFQSRSSAICGSKLPNGWGLFDVHGNTWEWCDDSDGPFRVFRGGGWANGELLCDSAYRNRNEPSVRSPFGGFRVALNSTSVPAEAGQGHGAKPGGVGTAGVAEQRPTMNRD